MSGAVLGIAALTALAVSCGAAQPGSEFAFRLTAIALHESGDGRGGADPLIIGVNPDRARGLPAASIRSATPQEAAARANALIAQGRRIDLGLGQISDQNLPRHGLTVETAFDACRNMAAIADHYADDVHAVWTLAHRRYNTGSTERGATYAAGVEQVLARVRAQRASQPDAVSAPAAAPPAPALSAAALASCGPAPPSWDGWALHAHESCVRRAASAAPPPSPDGAGAPAVVALNQPPEPR